MNVLFSGGGTFACLLYAMFRDQIDVLGHFDDLTDNTLLKQRYAVPYLGGSGDASAWAETCPDVVIAVGTEGDLARRQAQFKIFKDAGFRFPVLIHPSAHVAPESAVGDGTIVQLRAIVHPHVSIGANCVVSTAAIVGHDSRIGDGVYVGPGAILNGSVVIGEQTFIGTGAIVIQKRSIGRGCQLAAAACVVQDAPDGARLAGVPARILPRAAS